MAELAPALIAEIETIPLPPRLIRIYYGLPIGLFGDVNEPSFQVTYPVNLQEDMVEEIFYDQESKECTTISIQPMRDYFGKPD